MSTTTYKVPTPMWRNGYQSQTNEEITSSLPLAFKRRQKSHDVCFLRDTWSPLFALVLGQVIVSPFPTPSKLSTTLYFEVNMAVSNIGIDESDTISST